MRCEDALNRLNARADGELPVADTADLDAHLAECAQCRVAAEALQAIDSELQRAFAPRREAAARLVERAVAAIRASAGAPMPAVPVPAAPLVGRSPAFAWMHALAGLAAGFLLAVAVFRPWQRLALPATMPPLEPVARLAIASGPVEVRAPSQLNFFTCPQDAPIAQDSTVRTGPAAQCEIALGDGNALRLDCNTEVTLRKPEVVEVNHGRLWSSCQSGPKPFEIQSGGGTIVSKSAAQFAVDCQPHATRLTVVDGAASVQTGQESVDVGAGKQAQIVDGRLAADVAQCDALLETSWVNSVLALRNFDKPELTERVDGLLASAGAAKLRLPYEDELRRLGDNGVPALLAYLASTRGTPSAAERAIAARIVGDVAQALDTRSHRALGG